jgi:hypothetical protein
MRGDGAQRPDRCCCSAALRPLRALHPGRRASASPCCRYRWGSWAGRQGRLRRWRAGRRGWGRRMRALRSGYRDGGFDEQAG